MDKALKEKSIFFVFHKQPMQKQKDKEDAATSEQNRGLTFNDFDDVWISTKRRRECLEDGEARGRQPNNHEREKPTHDEHRKDNPNVDKDLAPLGGHGGEDVGVDHGVVDRGDDLKQRKANHDHDQFHNGHTSNRAVSQ